MKCWICRLERKYTKKCSKCGEISCNGCNCKGVCMECWAKKICEG